MTPITELVLLHGGATEDAEKHLSIVDQNGVSIPRDNITWNTLTGVAINPGTGDSDWRFTVLAAAGNSDQVATATYSGPRGTPPPYQFHVFTYEALSSMSVALT